MSDRERLEAALRDGPTPEILAVYADLLQDAGDPRGELIHLSLEIAARDDSSELRAARKRLLETWLTDVPASAHYLAESGFVKLSTMDIDLVGTKLGELVTEATLSGTTDNLLGQLQKLGAGPRPWLHHLELRAHRVAATAAFAPEIIGAVIAQALHLATLEIRGTWLPGWSALRTPRITLDLEAALGLARSTDVLAAVTELALILPALLGRDRPALAPATLLAQLPSLTTLELGAAEPLQDVRDTMFDWLAGAELVRHLQRLVVPAPRRANLRALERIRARFEGELVVARAYAQYPFTIPGVTTPPLRPWRPLDEVTHTRLRFVVGTKTAHFTPDELDYWIVIDTLDRLANRGVAVDFAAWKALLTALGHPPRPCELRLAVLLAAFDTLPPDVEPTIAAFTTRMRELPPSLRDVATVRVTVA